MGTIKLLFTFFHYFKHQVSNLTKMSHYKAFENEQLTNNQPKEKSGSISLKWFALAAVGCVGAAALISYMRFSAPGPRADFQEGETNSINPKFRDVQLKYVEEDIVEENFEVETTTTTTTATHQYTETIQQEENENVPSYLLGYGETFVYQPNQNQQAQNQQYQAAQNAYEVPEGSAEGVTGSGDGYQTVDLSSPAQPVQPVHASSISCWTCQNAQNWAECAQHGTLVQCEASATSCELEIRRRDGSIEQINTGCKQAAACENNKAQNYDSLDYTDNNQCRPDEDEGPSVCRQCCHSNNCNYMLDFIDLDGWRQELY